MILGVLEARMATEVTSLIPILFITIEIIFTIIGSYYHYFYHSY